MYLLTGCMTKEAVPKIVVIFPTKFKMKNHNKEKINFIFR